MVVQMHDLKNPSTPDCFLLKPSLRIAFFCHNILNYLVLITLLREECFIKLLQTKQISYQVTFLSWDRMYARHESIDNEEINDPF